LSTDHRYKKAMGLRKLSTPTIVFNLAAITILLRGSTLSYNNGETKGGQKVVALGRNTCTMKLAVLIRLCLAEGISRSRKLNSVATCGKHF